MRILFFIVLSTIISLIISVFFDINIDDTILSTIYNIVGIFFAIGMGLIVTFTFPGVKNKQFIDIVRCNIKSIQKNFINIFFICTILFILNKIFIKNIYICTREFNFYELPINPINAYSLFVLIFYLITIFYIILNFIQIQNIHNHIFDTILEEENELLQK